jgi:hypothetical protein
MTTMSRSPMLKIDFYIFTGVLTIFFRQMSFIIDRNIKFDGFSGQVGQGHQG